jgi:hypothetical protein
MHMTHLTYMTNMTPGFRTSRLSVFPYICTSTIGYGKTS